MYKLKRPVLVTGVAVALSLFLAFAAPAMFPDTDVVTFTGCLGTNGQLKNLRAADAPTSPCGGGETEVKLSGGDMTSVRTPAAGGLQGGTDNGAASLSLQSSYRLPQGCATGETAKVSAAAWVCANDNDTTTNAGNWAETRPEFVGGGLHYCACVWGANGQLVKTGTNDPDRLQSLFLFSGTWLVTANFSILNNNTDVFISDRRGECGLTTDVNTTRPAEWNLKQFNEIPVSLTTVVSTVTPTPVSIFCLVYGTPGDEPNDPHVEYSFSNIHAVRLAAQEP